MVPFSPLCFSHPLPKAVLLLCKAVQMSLSPLKGEGAVACLSHCDRASSYLRSSISVPLAQSGNWLNKVDDREPAANTAALISVRSPLGVRCLILSLSLNHIKSHTATHT